MPDLYKVPKEEEIAFAKLKKFSIFDDLTSLRTFGIYMPPNGFLDVSHFESFYNHIRGFDLEWDLVVSVIVVPEDTLDKCHFKIHDLSEDDNYIKQVAQIFKVRVTSKEMKSFILQSDFLGMKYVYDYLFKKSFGLIEEASGRKKQPEIYEFFSLLPSSPKKALIEYYYKLINRYGASVVNGSVLRFYERLVAFYSGEDMQLSNFYQRVLQAFKTRHSIKRVFTSVRLLADSELPMELRVLNMLNQLDNSLKIG